MEILRGPNSAQDGSDALGGSVQFLSRTPTLSPNGRPRMSGMLGLAAGSADRLGGANLAGSVQPCAVRSDDQRGRPHDGRNASGRRHRLACGGHPLLRRRVRSADGRAAARHRLPPVRRAGPRTLVSRRDSQVVLHYTRSRQDEGRRYDQLLGGDGNLLADLRGLTLDLFYARVERIRAGPFDRASLTYSVNSQREERVNQGGNGNPRATITFEPSGHGARGQRHRVEGAVGPPDAPARRRRVRRGVDAPSTALNPVTGAAAPAAGACPTA